MKFRISVIATTTIFAVGLAIAAFGRFGGTSSSGPGVSSSIVIDGKNQDNTYNLNVFQNVSGTYTFSAKDNLNHPLDNLE
jgi:hypothetical protein